MEKRHILLIKCGDQKGLVHKVTGVLYRHGLNVVSNHEYVDVKQEIFFMRTEFSGATEPEKILEDLGREMPISLDAYLTEKRKKRIVVLATKEPHCLGDLLIRHEYEKMNAEILAVISNHGVLRALVEKFGIPYFQLSHQGKSREEHEREILAILSRYEVDYLVLAKYMRILSEEFVAHYNNRIINIHHSFLPAFVGANPYAQAYRRGVKIIGATAHFVTTNLDEGPIVTQGVTTVDHSHTIDDMVRAGEDTEKTVLARALKLAFEDRIFVHENKTVIFD